MDLTNDRSVRSELERTQQKLKESENGLREARAQIDSQQAALAELESMKSRTEALSGEIDRLRLKLNTPTEFDSTTEGSSLLQPPQHPSSAEHSRPALVVFAVAAGLPFVFGTSTVVLCVSGVLVLVALALGFADRTE